MTMRQFLKCVGEIVPYLRLKRGVAETPSETMTRENERKAREFTLD